MEPRSRKKPSPPLDEERIERLALHYVGRYATTRAKLKSYLARKLKERGWNGDKGPDLDCLVDRLAGLGYVDDRAFAAAKAASLRRRGYGERRLDQALKSAGIDAEDAGPVREEARGEALQAALRYAERKRIGPYAQEEAGREARQKAFAAMMRAGHRVDIALQVLNASPGDFPECDTL